MFWEISFTRIVFALNHEGKILASWSRRGTRKQDFLDWTEKIKTGFNERIYTDAGFFINELHIFECYARSQLIGRFVIVAEGQLTEKEPIGWATGSFFFSHQAVGPL